MIEILLGNLQLMGILAVLFCGSYGANMLLGFYNNIGLNKQNFSKEKFLCSIIKAVIVLFSGLFITSIISILPAGLSTLGIVIDEALLDGLNIAAIGGTIITSIVKYLKDALAKFYAILIHKPAEDKAEE